VGIKSDKDYESPTQVRGSENKTPSFTAPLLSFRWLHLPKTTPTFACQLKRGVGFILFLCQKETTGG
jgi:hypothetical protein